MAQINKYTHAGYAQHVRSNGHDNLTISFHGSFERQEHVVNNKLDGKINMASYVMLELPHVMGKFDAIQYLLAPRQRKYITDEALTYLQDLAERTPRGRQTRESKPGRRVTSVKDLPMSIRSLERPRKRAKAAAA